MPLHFRCSQPVTVMTAPFQKRLSPGGGNVIQGHEESDKTRPAGLLPGLSPLMPNTAGADLWGRHSHPSPGLTSQDRALDPGTSPAKTRLQVRLPGFQCPDSAKERGPGAIRQSEREQKRPGMFLLSGLRVTCTNHVRLVAPGIQRSCWGTSKGTIIETAPKDCARAVSQALCKATL